MIPQKQWICLAKEFPPNTSMNYFISQNESCASALDVQECNSKQSCYAVRASVLPDPS